MLKTPGIISLTPPPNNTLSSPTAQPQPARLHKAEKKSWKSSQIYKTLKNKDDQPTHYPFRWFFLQHKCSKSIHWVFAMILPSPTAQPQPPKTPHIRK